MTNYLKQNHLLLILIFIMVFIAYKIIAIEEHSYDARMYSGDNYIMIDDIRNNCM